MIEACIASKRLASNHPKQNTVTTPSKTVPVFVSLLYSVENAYALYKGRRRPASALVLDSTANDYGKLSTIELNFIVDILI